MSNKNKSIKNKSHACPARTSARGRRGVTACRDLLSVQAHAFDVLEQPHIWCRIMIVLAQHCALRIKTSEWGANPVCPRLTCSQSSMATETTCNFEHVKRLWSVSPSAYGMAADSILFAAIQVLLALVTTYSVWRICPSKYLSVRHVGCECKHKLPTPLLAKHSPMAKPLRA